MKLHGAIISPNVRKVIIACMIKDVKFDSKMLIPGPELKKPEFLAINPLGMIPAIEDGPLTIGDSNVILNYLEEKYAGPSLLPDTAEDKALCRWLAEYAGAALFPVCGTLFREVFINPNYFKQPIDQAVIDETITNKFPPVLNYLESHMPEEGLLFGEDLTIADISIISMFINASYAGFNVNSSRWPKLANYIAHLFERPEIMRCIENEAAMITMIKG